MDAHIAIDVVSFILFVTTHGFTRPTQGRTRERIVRSPTRKDDDEDDDDDG